MRRRPVSFGPLLALALLAAAPGAAQEAPAPAPAAPPEGPADAAPAAPPVVEAPPAPTPTAATMPGQTSVVDTVVEEKQEGDAFPLHLSASLTQNLGSATLVLASPAADGIDPAPRALLPHATFFTTTEITPSLTLGDFSFSLSQGLGFEWTQSDGTTYANQLEVADTRLGVRYGGLRWDDLGLSLGLSAGYNVPISLSSRWVGSLGTVGTGARLAWSWKDIGLSVYGGANVGYTFIVKELSARGAPPTPFQTRLGDSVTPGVCAETMRAGEQAFRVCSGNGTAFRYSTSLGTSWTTLNDQLTLGADLGFGHTFQNYYGPDDEYRAEHAIAGWNPWRPYTSGTLSASYTPVEWFTLTGGTSSGQPMFGGYAYNDTVAHDDQLTLPRFPFWDFVSPANNFSTFFVDTTFTL